MDKKIIPDLIEKGIAWFGIDYTLKLKNKKNETWWMTKNPSNRGT
jgi:hypothetical protein